MRKPAVEDSGVERGGTGLRCFAAVAITAPAVRRALEGAENQLRRAVGVPDPAKWVPAHQLHITLKFLGEISVAQAGHALAALERAVAIRPFSIDVVGLGAFPSFSRPSVLWAGLEGGRDTLVDLASAVEREMALEGFPPERHRFQPHITLGRVREGARVPAAVEPALASAARTVFGTVAVDRLLLMKSELTPRGPIYSELGFSALREEKG